MLHCPIGTHTSPMYLPCWSMWTVNVIVDIPISNQRSLENVCKDFLRCLSARLVRNGLDQHSAYTFGVDAHTIVVHSLDSPLPSVFLDPTPFQPSLLPTVSSMLIWLRHCVVESIVDLWD